MESYEIRFAGIPPVACDPQKEKLMDHRRRNRGDRMGKEKTAIRRSWNRQNRRKMELAVRRGEDVIPPRKTSGWLSW